MGLSAPSCQCPGRCHGQIVTEVSVGRFATHNQNVLAGLHPKTDAIGPNRVQVQQRGGVPCYPSHGL